MTSLQMQTKTTHYVKYSDFEEFVQQTYHIAGYSVVAAEECDNDSVLAFSATGELDGHDAKQFERMLTETWSWYFNTRIILNRAVADGHIPAGEYIIEVSW